ncbi:MAG: family N-acetyltransferase [Solirubrobacterales bacterium]|nr:family N-acetyltransferase [Solirubrobacterales bacterium]
MSPVPIEFPAEGLSDGIVRLRLMGDADIPAIVEAVRDPEIPRYTRVPEPYGEGDARHWQRMASAGLRAGTDLPTLIVDAEDGRVLGAVAVHNLDPASGRCSAGYWVAATERGRGFARRGLTLLCRFAFDELGAQRIELWIEPANGSSLRVAEATGFHREGLLRSFMPIGDVRRDMLMYSLLPKDLR